MEYKNNVGVLLPLSALCGDHGIGDISKYAYQFIDWLEQHHYHYWQILPLNPLGPGNSPYMSECSEAIDIRYICLNALKEEGLLDKLPSFQENSESINYEEVYNFKLKYLKKAFRNIKNINEVLKFNKRNVWADRYASYLILKNINQSDDWTNWKIHQIPQNKNKEKLFYVWTQYVAYSQWQKLLRYAKKKDVKIIADCPFYVGLKSTDCYFNQKYFLLDENHQPTLVSGCPPDGFSAYGQLWGTPIYDFTKMKKDKYSFLIKRISFLAKHCHYLRLDHFRAFDTYCVIPSEDTTAINGKWEKGPGYEFFDILFKKYPHIKLIAEDLGILFDSVHLLRDHYHLPGMSVKQFCAFENHQYDHHVIVYSGTHDNQTLFGWLKSLNREQRKLLNEKYDYPLDLYGALFNDIYQQDSLITIFPLQDLLMLDDHARINTPGTMGKPNWSFKFKNMDWMNNIKYGHH